jgi:hypothetical protein
MPGTMAFALVLNGREEHFDCDLIRVLADQARGRSPRLADRLDDAVARQASLKITDRDADVLVRLVDAMITADGGFNRGLNRVQSFARRASSLHELTAVRPVRA